jgi:DNA-directed RNA polymerase specialized sigma24 family protein
MLINYKDADGRAVELEVTEEVGQFYLTSLDQERKTERRETRRHTLLSTFTYEDARFFDSGIDICGEIALSDAVRRAMDKLTARERYLITAIHHEGRSYTEIGKAERKSPSTIMRETRKAVERFKRFYGDRE